MKAIVESAVGLSSQPTLVGVPVAPASPFAGQGVVAQDAHDGLGANGGEDAEEDLEHRGHGGFVSSEVGRWEVISRVHGGSPARGSMDHESRDFLLFSLIGRATGLSRVDAVGAHQSTSTVISRPASRAPRHDDEADSSTVDFECLAIHRDRGELEWSRDDGDSQGVLTFEGQPDAFAISVAPAEAFGPEPEAEQAIYRIEAACDGKSCVEEPDPTHAFPERIALSSPTHFPKSGLALLAAPVRAVNPSFRLVPKKQVVGRCLDSVPPSGERALRPADYRGIVPSKCMSKLQPSGAAISPTASNSSERLPSTGRLATSTVPVAAWLSVLNP